MKDKKRYIRNSTAEFLVFTSQASEDGIEVRGTFSDRAWDRHGGWCKDEQS